MYKLNKKVVINPTFSADDWYLLEIAGREAVALMLNSQLAFAFNEGFSRDKTHRHMIATFQALSETTYGETANPRLGIFLSNVLDELYSNDDWK